MNVRCDFHSGATGHETDKCYNLRHKIQDLIDEGFLKFELGGQDAHPIQENNMGPSTNAISSDWTRFDPSQLITSPGTKLRLRFENEEDLPMVAVTTALTEIKSEEEEDTTMRGTIAHPTATDVEKLREEIQELKLFIKGQKHPCREVEQSIEPTESSGELKNNLPSVHDGFTNYFKSQEATTSKGRTKQSQECFGHQMKMKP